MPRFLLLTGFVFCLFLGCGKGGSSSPTASTITDVAPAAVAPEADWARVLTDLTQALRKFSVDQRRVPTSLSELVTTGYIPTMPQPPPGKTFGIDAKEIKVILK